MEHLRIRLHRELSAIQEKYMGFSVRQWISLILTAIITLPAYFFFLPSTGSELASWIVLILGAPILLWGFVRVQGLSFFPFLKVLLRQYLEFSDPLTDSEEGIKEAKKAGKSRRQKRKLKRKRQRKNGKRRNTRTTKSKVQHPSKQNLDQTIEESASSEPETSFRKASIVNCSRSELTARSITNSPAKEGSKSEETNKETSQNQDKPQVRPENSNKAGLSESEGISNKETEADYAEANQPRQHADFSQLIEEALQTDPQINPITVSNQNENDSSAEKEQSKPSEKSSEINRWTEIHSRLNHLVSIQKGGLYGKK